MKALLINQKRQPLYAITVVWVMLQLNFICVSVQANRYTVSSTANSGVGTLRQAIADASANPGADTIVFNIAGAAPHTITLTGSGLALSGANAAGTVIDATTQPANGYVGSGPYVIISGNNALATYCFQVHTTGIEIYGLGITGFTTSASNNSPIMVTASGSGFRIGAANKGNYIYGNGTAGASTSIAQIRVVSADYGYIQGNYIGVMPDGSTAPANNVGSGIVLESGANGHIVGGNFPGQGNLISGNLRYGIRLIGSSNNHLTSNIVGANASGASALANRLDGIRLESASNDNLISGNLVSGNGNYGIRLNSSIGNLLTDNKVGVNETGTAAIPNMDDGIRLEANSNYNIIENNLVSGNDNNGIQLNASSFCTVSHNYAGVDVFGSSAIPNGEDGILLQNGSNDNLVTGNVASGNEDEGLQVLNSTRVILTANKVGTDASGTSALMNESFGIYLVTCTDITVGGVSAGDGNLVSGNGLCGIHSESGTNVLFEGNVVGTDITGTYAIPNQGSAGIHVDEGDHGAVIRNNLVSGNRNQGIGVRGLSTDVLIVGNLVGVSRSGDAAIPNNDGIRIEEGPTNVTVGGCEHSLRNIVSGNDDKGIEIRGVGGTVETIININGNYIGTDTSGQLSIANQGDGIHVSNVYQGLTIGDLDPTCGNVISSSRVNGIYLNNVNSTKIQSNYIGTTAPLADGTTSCLGNTVNGIYFTGTSRYNQVGSISGIQGQNTIACNGQNGIRISPNTSFGNKINHNSFYNNTSRAIFIISGANSGNNAKPAPAITYATSTQVCGTAQPGDIIELYLTASQTGSPQGKSFIASTTADAAGAWCINTSLSFASGSPLCAVTVLATDASGNTSEFGLCSTVLPVEASKLQAERQDNQVMLSWQTYSETNNQRFDIERAEPNGAFVKIGEVVPQETMIQAIRSYQFVDYSPLIGSNIYRYRQVDFNGQYTFSNLAEVVMAHSTLPLYIYPNPAKASDSLIWPSGNSPQSVSVYELSGKRLFTEQRAEHMPKLHQNLSPGIYLLIIDQPNAPSQHLKLVVQ